MKYDVFISYCRKDSERVKAIKKDIEQATGVKCWMDMEGISYDSPDFVDVIVKAIDNAPVFLFMLSEHSQISRIARGEITLAQKKEKHISIINIDKCEMSDMFTVLYSQNNLCDYSEENQKKKLFSEICSWLGINLDSKDKTITSHQDNPAHSVEAEIHIEVDADCNLYSFKTFLMKLEAKKDNVIRLNPGKYKLEFVSTQNPKIKTSMVYSLASDMSCDFIEVKLKDEEEKTNTEVIASVSKLDSNCVVPAKIKAIPNTPAKSSSTAIQTFTVGKVSFNMVRVDGGTFMMGATSEQENDACDDEKPVHQVTLSSYYIGETEVTQALWETVMGSNPSRFKGRNRPVEKVSWKDCLEFILKLNQKIGLKFRLPTEAEWEFAARGGNKSKGCKYSGGNNIGDVAWYDDNSEDKTHTFKTKQANELGLYDMSGNVWEWCQDWWGDYPSSAQMNPTGPSWGTNHVGRGGSWRNNARFCRVSSRKIYSPDHMFYYLGFRLALSDSLQKEK